MPAGDQVCDICLLKTTNLRSFCTSGCQLCKSCANKARLNAACKRCKSTYIPPTIVRPRIAKSEIKTIIIRAILIYMYLAHTNINMGLTLRGSLHSTELHEQSYLRMFLFVINLLLFAATAMVVFGMLIVAAFLCFEVLSPNPFDLRDSCAADLKKLFNFLRHINIGIYSLFAADIIAAHYEYPLWDVVPTPIYIVVCMINADARKVVLEFAREWAKPVLYVLDVLLPLVIHAYNMITAAFGSILYYLAAPHVVVAQITGAVVHWYTCVKNGWHVTDVKYD